MKKLFLILAAVSTLAASSQTKELDNLNKRLVKSDEAIADAKKSGSVNTWLERSDALLAAFKAYTNMLVPDFSVDQTLILIGLEPSEIVDVEVTDKKYKQYVFDNFDMYVDENGQVMFWNTKRQFRPDALNGALDALKKAYEIDAAVVSGGKGYLVGQNLLNEFNTDGMNLYSLDKKAEAALLFSKAVETNQMLGVVDSVMIYYTGVAYNDAGMLDKALEYMKKAKEIGYELDGSVDTYISYIYEKQGDKEAAITTIESALIKYPADNRMVNQLLNLYMDTKRSPEKIVSVLNKAKELDPKNASLYMLEGSLWEGMGDSDKAEKAFLESTTVDPNNFAGYMNAAIMRARKGDNLVEQSKKLDLNDVKGYNALIGQAVPFYDGAIELLEKAHVLNPSDKNIIDLLKSLYYQKQQESPEMEAKYKHYNDLSN